MPNHFCLTNSHLISSIVPLAGLKCLNVKQYLPCEKRQIFHLLLCEGGNYTTFFSLMSSKQRQNVPMFSPGNKQCTEIRDFRMFLLVHYCHSNIQLQS